MLATATVAVLIGFTMAILVGLVLSTLVEVTRSHRRELERLVSVPLPDTEIWPDSDPYEARSLSEKQCSKRYASLVECKDAIYSTTKSRLL